MKSKLKKRASIIIVLGIFFAISSIYYSNPFLKAVHKEKSTVYRDYFTLDRANLKISAVSGKIHIDNNWTAAKSAGICTGDGTYSDPYVIEDLVIDGENSGSCILIEYSNVYFRIENCTLYNAGTGSSSAYAGIKLDHVNNGTLLNNNCSKNYYGIWLVHSDNNTLSGNTANNNFYGIFLKYSDNNTLSGNTINNNIMGIILFHSDNSTLSGNLMSFCGISLSGSLAELASHSIDDTNLVNNKPVYYYVNETGLGSNNFTDAGQIILINCNNSIISGLNLSNSRPTGIYLGYSNNNTLSGNIASNNFYYGIWLVHSDNNTLSGNTINNNMIGIILFHSDNSNIILNCFINNTYNAQDDGINNTWDDGFTGNYWSDYTGSDADGDGIGDVPHNITGSAGSQDNFPLMKCPLPVQDDNGGGIPIELIILISVISGGAVIGVVTLLLIIRKRKSI